VKCNNICILYYVTTILREDPFFLTKITSDFNFIQSRNRSEPVLAKIKLAQLLPGVILECQI
jgi:hypothetical protein